MVTRSPSHQPVPAELYAIAPLLALTSTAAGALVAGLGFMLLLAAISCSVSLTRHFIAWRLRLPCLLLIVATWAGLFDMVVTASFYELRDQFGIYLPLLVFNSLVFALAEGYYLRMPAGPALRHAARTGLAIFFLFLATGLVRELLSAGSPGSWQATLAADDKRIAMAGMAPGAYICLGLILALWQYLVARFSASRQQA